MDAYVRRKRWEFQEQAEAVINAYGDALSGKGKTRPPAGAPSTAAPTQGGLERSRTGKIFKRVSASQLMNVVEARRLPPQG